MKVMPGVKLEFVEPIEPVARRAMTEASSRLHRAVDVRHPIRVKVVPAHVVERRGKKGFGLFLVRWRRPEIWLAAWRLDRSMSDWSHAQNIVATFARQLAYYEQWRDGREVQERGVAVRARNIAARLLGK